MADVPLNSDRCSELADTIQNLTHTGGKELQLQELKKVTNICKLSDKYVEHTFALLMHQLEKEHAEIRFSAFQICDAIFRRSHQFRELVIADLQHIFELTMDTNPELPLPPPRSAALELKKNAIKTLQNWTQHYGSGYKKLKLGFNFLRRCKKVDFHALEILNNAERERREEKERRLRVINEERLKKTAAEMEGGRARIVENEENATIIESARDQFVLISNRYLPKVKAWLLIITKAEGRTEMLKKTLQLKTSLEKAVEKYQRMDIERTENEDSVSTDSEMEEVMTTSYDAKSKTALTRREDGTQWSIMSKEENTLDPTTASAASKVEPKASTSREAVRCGPTASTSKEKSPVASTSKEKSPVSSTIKEPLSVGRKKKLLAIAPKLPFDIDLYHWEDEHLITPTMLPVGTDGHRFWSSVSADDVEAVPVPDGAASLRTRVIEYTGSFEPVTRSCRVPLGSGKLCPRQDRYKCPFHGIIVSRDALGKCVDKEDEERLASLAEAEKIPDWQDPQLLQEIKEATGVDLQMPTKKKKRIMKKSNKFPGLTDIRSKQNTVTQRLAKKVFTKSAMKRVATALDKLDHRRFRDKYGDQFHYMYDTA